MSSHPFFNCVGAACGVDFLAPQGWNTHREWSAVALARLIRQIRRDEVLVGGTLYSDVLSKRDGPVPTCLRLIEHNGRSLAAALQAWLPNGHPPQEPR